MNLKVRIKNPLFWLCLGGVIITAMGIDAEMLTTWSAVWEANISLFTNPFMLVSVVLAILGVLMDPTTSGVGDSSLAMTYKKPKKE